MRARPASVGDLVGVDPVAARGEHEQRLHVAVVRRRDEDQAVGDLGGGDAQRLGGRLRGAHGQGQVAHLGRDVVQRQGVHDRPDAGVSGQVARRCRLARLWGHGASVVTGVAPGRRAFCDRRAGCRGGPPVLSRSASPGCSGVSSDGRAANGLDAVSGAGVTVVEVEQVFDTSPRSRRTRGPFRGSVGDSVLPTGGARDSSSPRPRRRPRGGRPAPSTARATSSGAAGATPCARCSTPGRSAGPGGARSATSPAGRACPACRARSAGSGGSRPAHRPGRPGCSTSAATTTTGSCCEPTTEHLAATHDRGDPR